MKKTLFLLFIFSSFAVFGQTLTISSTGETGTSGTNWSLTGGTLTISGTASISASVIETAMTSSSLTIVPSVTSPYNLSVTIDEAITSSNAGSSIIIGASTNTGSITFNQPVAIDGGITVHGNNVVINNDIATTNTTTGNITINAYGPTNPILGNGNISIASGKQLNLYTNYLNAICTLGGIISGTNSNLSVNGIQNGSQFIFTQNNQYSGTTAITKGSLILRNDAPNPASKNFTGSIASFLLIEPLSASFTSTFSNSGYTFQSTFGGLTIGKTDNISDVTIDNTISISGTTIIHCTTLNLNANISATSAGRNVQIYCINPLINATAARTITASSIFGIYAPTSGFTTDLIYPITNLTNTQTILELGSTFGGYSFVQNKDVIINSDIVNDNYISINGKNIILNNNLTSTNGQIQLITNGGLVVATPQTINAAGGLNYVSQSPSFDSDVAFPIPNLTVTSNGITIGKYTNVKNLTIETDLTTTGTGAISLNGANISINSNLRTIATGNMTLRGNITVAAGKYIQCGGNFLVAGPMLFKSDATGSAAFGTLGGTFTGGSGLVTTERYIPANKRSFRFLSPSVTTTSAIKFHWQENGVNTAGLGTHITGNGGAANGFDATSTNNPSMFGYDHTNGTWTAVTNTNTNTLTAGTPYRLMVRGDRTISLTTNTPTPTATTLRASGTLHTGNFTPTLNQNADGFSFIGNPYQAPVNIKTVLAAATGGVNSGVVYYWDPTLNLRGGWVARNLTANTNDVTSSFNEFIQPNQAVFVKNSSSVTAPALTFTETDKAIANAAAGVFKTNNNTALLRLKLMASIDNQMQGIDGALVLFNEDYSWDVTQDDITKMGNLDEQVSFKVNNTELAIASQNNPIANAVLPISFSKNRQENYQWEFELENYNGLTPYLFDAQNQSYTEIENGTNVAFSTANLNATEIESRFSVVFAPSTLGTNTFEQNIALYPNPAKANQTEFILQGVDANSSVTMFNLLGQQIPVGVETLENSLRVTPKTNLSKGVYLVTIKTNQGSTSRKWIVE